MTSSRPIDLTLDNTDAHLTQRSTGGYEVDSPKETKEESDDDSCSICLHRVEDRTVIPNCSHEFCFECLLVWIGQSRRCPLCNQAAGEYVIHNIRSRYDYQKHFLAPLKSASPTRRTEQQAALRNVRERAARRRRERRGNGPHDGMDEADRLERSIQKRKWIYEHDLYAKHVGSNKYTKYRPYPTPFLTNLIISLMKSIDIRSESAVKLLAEFLDMDGGKSVNAEHFAHEVYCYIRSPYKDLFVYDTIVQYDTPAGIQPPSEITRRRRWDHRDDSRSPSPQASGSQGRYSREWASRGGEPEANHMIDPLPRSKRNAPQADSRRQPEYVASSSRLTLDNAALSTGQVAGSSLPSTRPQSLTASPTPRYVTNSESHTHGVVQHHGDRKGKERDQSSPGIPTMPQGEPSVDREVNKSTGTSRPRIRKDLKSSILSHLALTTGESTKEGSSPMNLDGSMIVD
ncbi:hypothetical protein FA13DRAFT_1743749 [Coprinellus micaceus]|uniref:RING-type E3 ubiquitin transferase n=1 Tax=Coprinellus micaceus TaxID=71717 RepID=A0A4Y7SE64_COPMI|nr:hypothetical protein FA13DRAFT_1743749 [Coprinellus micaceus]